MHRSCQVLLGDLHRQLLLLLLLQRLLRYPTSHLRFDLEVCRILLVLQMRREKDLLGLLLMLGRSCWRGPNRSLQIFLLGILRLRATVRAC